MDRETVRTLLYANRTIDIAIGAGFGKLKPNVDIFVKNIRSSDKHQPNPDEKVITNSFIKTLSSRGLDLSLPDSWANVSWVSNIHKGRSLERYFLTSIAFSDDHKSRLHHEFLPITKGLEFQQRVVESSHRLNKSISIPQQFDIALEIADGNPLDASVIAFIGSRSIGRNHDQRVDPIGNRFLFTEGAMNEWLDSVSSFDISPKFDPLGDTYHWWTCCTMGMLIRANNERYPIKSKIIKKLYDEGATIMVLLRNKLAKRELNFVHKEVDLQGLNVGWKVADYFISYMAFDN